MISLQTWNVLGSGTYGSVETVAVCSKYGAQIDPSKLYACKTLRKQALGTTTWHQVLCKELFSAEGEAIGPKVHAAFLADGETRLLLDLYSGTFSQVLAALHTCKPFQDCGQQVMWMRDIVKQLAMLHRRGIAHRDLKDANILLREVDMRASLCDFGMTLGPLERKSSSLYVCTMTYRAPEVFQGQEHDTAMDMWSLGMLMRNMLTRTLSFGSWHNSEVPEETPEFRKQVFDELESRCSFTDKTLLPKFLENHQLDSISLASLEVLLTLDMKPSRRMTAQQLLDSVTFRWDQPRYRERPATLAAEIFKQPVKSSGGPALQLSFPPSLYSVYTTEKLRTRPCRTLESVRREQVLYALARYYTSYGGLNFFTYVWTLDIFDRLYHGLAVRELGQFFQQELMTLSIYIVQLLSRDIRDVTRLEVLRKMFTPTAQNEAEKLRIRALFYKALETLQGRVVDPRLSTIELLKTRKLEHDKHVQKKLLRAYAFWPDGNMSREEFLDDALVNSLVVSEKWESCLQTIV